MLKGTRWNLSWDLMQGYCEPVARLLLILIPVAVTIYAFIDAISAPKASVRLLPKWVWVICIVLLPFGGAVLWLFLGRPKPIFGSGLDQAAPRPRRPQGPDDDPDFLRGL